YAYENGVIVVAAGGQVIDVVTYPGKFSRTIGVGGVRRDRQAWFKYDRIWLDRIDVWGPADDVWRANTTLDNDIEKYRYGDGDGTSYATVHVAGAAAMWLVARGRDIEGKYSELWQRAEAFRKLVKKTHQPVMGSYKPAEGTGILDIKALIEADLPTLRKQDFRKQEAAGEIF
ncbi:MAG: S8/S53 family peptidase, partial [Alphaproteobacteria bacterium]